MLNDSWREIRARFYNFFLFFSFLANEFFLSKISCRQEEIFVRDRCLVVFFLFFSTWHVETMIWFLRVFLYICMYETAHVW